MYEVPVVLLAFKLLSRFFTFPFGIAKSSERNPFSDIKCNKEKVCVNFKVQSITLHVFKLFLT